MRNANAEKNILEEAQKRRNQSSKTNDKAKLNQTQNILNPKQANKNDANFSNENLLSSKHHSFTRNTKSAITAYFYTNTNTILSKSVMSYEEQLKAAIKKANIELCQELLKIQKLIYISNLLFWNVLLIINSRFTNLCPLFQKTLFFFIVVSKLNFLFIKLKFMNKIK